MHLSEIFPIFELKIILTLTLIFYAMKLRLLLFLMLIAGILNAQEPYRSLVITESRANASPDNYVEITNMGNQSIQLSEFKFGKVTPWSPAILDLYNDPWVPGNEWFFLPERILEPGESIVITGAYDFGPRQYYKKVAGFEGSQRPKQIDIYDVADILLHFPEPKGDATDKRTTNADYRGGTNIPETIGAWHGREGWYIEHHFAEGDSAVIDQVNMVFDRNGQNQGWPDAPGAGYDVAGVAMATRTANLVRKYSVKTGNLDFANARGVGNDDSEWIALLRPEGYSSWRDTWWTVGNHGPYVLDENTLESDVIDVDFAGKKLTLPWGVRRLDDIMRHMVKKPGIAWDYHLNSNREDSLFHSAKTGDKITIKVVGNELTSAIFDIVVSEPTAGANIVVPIDHVDIASVAKGGPIRTNTQRGSDGMEWSGWPRVTKHAHGTDTITGSWHGLPNALRTDSLMKYLEKPANATWEFVFVDGVTRPDLKDGDKLKVTSANGAVKEYYLQVQPYGPNHDGTLASITWPDIPNFYRGIFGWMGDTIPSFNPTTFNYRVQVPLDVDGIPALIAKPQNINATLDVKRATSLSGTTADRTVSFIVTAEDDSVTNTYNVELIKEKDPSNVQPFFAEPFLSELIFWEQWSNGFGELVNPGNQPLDLSNYMIAMQWNADPSSVIQSRMGENDWLDRYDKYVPGYKWVNQAQWAVTPGILEQDLSVNPIVQPGDVFTFGGIWTDAFAFPGWLPNFEWTVPKQLDVQFNNYDGIAKYRNPWGENISGNGSPIRKWMNSNWYMFKILNDSIKLGLKPANDPKDFELIEYFGMSDVSNWIIGGVQANMISNYSRKPHVWKGRTEAGAAGSFGTNLEDTEWTWTNRPYWQARNVGWPMEILNIGNDFGQHFMDEPTHYKSTVTAVVYKVSDGYSMNEEIRGLTTGTTVSTFIANLNKANENQVLTVKSGDSELGSDDIINMNDVLVVLSADSTNTSQYRLDVTEEGLSSNAVLTSTLYDIEIVSQPKSAAEESDAGSGIISGFDYGTQLQTILNNITVPMGANLDVIDSKGAYVSLKKLNFDTAYVNVTVNPDTYFEVTAENGVTKIIYQLQPNASDNDAFILSDVYNVSQSQNLVEFVPRGTNVNTFMSNIIPSLGASVKLVDKMGLERTEGTLYQDDKVVVVSPNGLVTKVYHLSMLRTQYILSTTYLAYVLSNEYAVDQVDYIIEGATTTTSINDFYARITPSMGATAVVVDANGNAKTTGTLVNGDMLKVTSADGHIEVMYELKVVAVSSNLTSGTQIEIYPNPTTGRLNVRGVEAGNRIQIYNSNGAVIRDMKVRSNVEVLSIDDQPAGMYLIVISNDNTLLGRYKAVKK
jgi:hypothetical protein